MLNQTPPLISVLVPTRNRAGIVPETLDSVLAQTWTDFELVVSNNHSKDNTDDVLTEYARRDPRIRLIAPPEDCSMTAHWNWAWTQLRGTYGALLSDDDQWEPGFLQSVAGTVEAHPETDVAGTDMTYWHPSDPAKTHPRGVGFDKFNGFLPDPLVPVLRHFLIHLNCALIRREAFFEVGGYGSTIVGDSELWIKAALAGKKFHYTNDPLLKYRVHATQASDDHMVFYLAQMMEQLLTRPGLSWQQRLRLRRTTGGLWAVAAKVHRSHPVENPTPIAYYANGIKVCPWHPANWVGMAQTLLGRATT